MHLPHFMGLKRIITINSLNTTFLLVQHSVFHNHHGFKDRREIKTQGQWDTSSHFKLYRSTSACGIFNTGTKLGNICHTHTCLDQWCKLTDHWIWEVRHHQSTPQNWRKGSELTRQIVVFTRRKNTHKKQKQVMGMRKCRKPHPHPLQPYLNPITAPAHKISRLKSAHTNVCKQHIWWTYNNSTFDTCAFCPFTCSCEEGEKP